MSKNSSNSIIVHLKPEWSELDKISELVKDFLANESFTIDDYHSIKMVTTELVENGIKYGNFLFPESNIQLSFKKKKNRVLIEVKNKIKDSQLEHLKRLDSQIQWIRGFQNPFEAYIEKLKEISGKTLSEGESGLGLVRISYEGQSVLDFYIDEESTLAVSAVYEY